MPDPVPVPVDRTPLDLDRLLNLIGPGPFVPGSTSGWLSDLATELVQARTDLQRAHAKAEGLFTESLQLADRIEDLTAERDRLAAQVERVEALCDALDLSDAVGVSWAAGHVRAALAVPAAEETTP